MGFLPDLQWDVCAYTKEVRDGTGLQCTPTRVGGTFQDYDIVILPGGFASRKLVDDGGFVEWIRTARPCRFKVSVCTGALLLGAAGFLKGKTATTHPNAFQNLEKYCSSVVDQRVVDEGDIITARGVSSSIDLGLYLCEKLAGREAKEKIRKQMDYPYGENNVDAADRSGDPSKV